MIHGNNDTDYEHYLNTKKLFESQKAFDALCNQDELQFQIVHQIEELWMKLIGYTVADIMEYIENKNTNRIRTLFDRVHKIQRMMIRQLDLLETMSPKEYQEIRLELGNGSGQESPGFRTLLKLAQPLWQKFEVSYLQEQKLENIYNESYKHDDTYVVAECLAEYDELFQKFRFSHFLLIQRTIGFQANSLKGRSVTVLKDGMRSKFFPKIWQVRNTMTDDWGIEYGVERDSISSSTNN